VQVEWWKEAVVNSGSPEEEPTLGPMLIGRGRRNDSGVRSGSPSGLTSTTNSGSWSDSPSENPPHSSNPHLNLVPASSLPMPLPPPPLLYDLHPLFVGSIAFLWTSSARTAATTSHHQASGWRTVKTTKASAGLLNAKPTKTMA
jgi:hypothetical protein